MNTREELIEKKNKLREDIHAIEDMINKLDYESRLSYAKSIVGKYYKELDVSDGFHYYVYVHGLNLNTLELHAIEIDYCDIDINWFYIQHKSHFEVQDHSCNIEYEEVTKEEFIKHYNTVMNNINTLVKL